MKNISQKQLKQLTKKGDIRPTGETIKARQDKQLFTDISKAAVAMEDTSMAVRNASAEISNSVLKLFKPLEPKKTWDFKIFRDEEGFIKNITATEI